MVAFASDIWSTPYHLYCVWEHSGNNHGHKPGLEHCEGITVVPNAAVLDRLRLQAKLKTEGLQPLDESAQENVYPEMSIAMEMSTLEQTHLKASVVMQKPVLSTPCSICVCGQSHARILQSICGCG